MAMEEKVDEKKEETKEKKMKKMKKGKGEWMMTFVAPLPLETRS